MNVTLAKFISVLFQPLLMTVIGTIIFFNLPYFEIEFIAPKAYWFIIISNILFTFLLPLFILLMLKRFKLISNLSMDKKEERKIPVLITIVLFAYNYYILNRLPLPDLYYSFLLASIFSVSICLIITMYWKISMHMAGLGGVVGAMIITSVLWQLDLRLLIAMLLLVAGITGSARLTLHAHTPEQVYTGFFVGLLPQIIAPFLYILLR